MESRDSNRSAGVMWTVFVAAALITAVVTELAAGGYQLGPVDDAYISLRYAANWAAGAGLVFNLGESVEGYTNFLLVLIEVGLIRCGLDPVLAMMLIGRVALACLGGLLALFTLTHIFPGRAIPAIAAGSLAAVNPILICWGVSGMESCLGAVLLLAGVSLTLTARTARGAVLSAIFLVLAAMTRPEAVVVFPVAVAVLYVQRKSRRLALIQACVLGVGFGAYFAARALHFGYLFPNTFYAKLDYGNVSLAKRGALYVWDFVSASPLLSVLALAALVLVRRAPLWVRACLLVVGVHLLAVVYMGGDHFALFRFLVPVVPFLALAALYPAAAMVKRHGWQRPAAVVAVVVSLAAIGASDLLVGGRNKRGETGPTTQWQRFVVECRLAEHWTTLGRWFGQHAQPEESLSTIAIGAIGYYSELRIVDPLGLVNPTIAHRKQRLGEGHAGHEKYDVQEVLAQRPGYILLVNLLTQVPVPLRALTQMDWGEFNRQLAREPGLYSDYRYHSIPLETNPPGYVNVFVRRDLPPLTAGESASDGE